MQPPIYKDKKIKFLGQTKSKKKLGFFFFFPFSLGGGGKGWITYDRLGHNPLDSSGRHGCFFSAAAPAVVEAAAAAISVATGCDGRRVAVESKTLESTAAKSWEFLDGHSFLPSEPILPSEHTLSFKKRRVFLLSTPKFLTYSPLSL